jgi:hypothetical protein
MFDSDILLNKIRIYKKNSREDYLRGYSFYEHVYS